MPKIKINDNTIMKQINRKSIATKGDNISRIEIKMYGFFLLILLKIINIKWTKPINDIATRYGYAFIIGYIKSTAPGVVENITKQ